MPVLRPLAGFKRPMQIVWLGQVRNMGRAGQFRPQIEVVLRPAEDPLAPTQRRLVPAAFVRAMRLGDVWHGPNLVATSSTSLIQLKGLHISGEAANVSPIGKPLEGAHGEYPLDFRSFSDHSGHTGAYAVRERLADGRWLELASQDEAREDEVIAPEAIDVLRGAVEILRGEKFNVSLQSLGATSVEELTPLQNILPGVGQLGKAFSCIGLRRGGGRARSAAYCLVRTHDDGLPIETAMLLYAPQQKVDAHRALSQAFDILQRGKQGGVGVASVPEFMANNPYAVAKFIRQLTW